MRWTLGDLSRMIACATIVAGAPGSAIAQQARPSLPYVAVHDPQFISAADATFMSADDRVIGVTSGGTAKAFPAAILSQHGLVEDQSPGGPIAVTW
jgi:uncharacterized protein DUF3179